MRLVLKGTDVSGNDERFDNSKLSCIFNVTRWSEQKFQFQSVSYPTVLVMWSCMNLNTMKITQRLKKKTSELSYLADFENGFRLNSISRSDSKTTNARMKLSKTLNSF